jgi:pSer/pThr/pTyr-binding forkhead associated (FHA) protein
VLVIGRGDGATWSIAHDDISRMHLEVRRTWDGVRVVDRESKNGVRVDGAKVADALLADGALLELGAVHLRFRDPANPAPARAAADPPRAVVATAPTVVTANSTHTIPSPRVSLLFYLAVGIGAAAVIALVVLLAT